MSTQTEHVDTSDRLDKHMRQLKRLIVSLYKQQRAGCQCRDGDSPHDEKTLVHQLGDSLRTAIDCSERLLCMHFSENSTPLGSFASDIARALSLAGNGERFELTIESVIRSYCSARRDVLRYQTMKDLGDDLRDDIVAGFTRVMEGHRLELQLMGVELEEVPPGAALDSQVHEVVRKVATRSRSRLSTVKDCITPIFRWSNADCHRLKPAQVTMYAAAKSSTNGVQQKVGSG